jgi:two-component system KDP operon response regulator KdpE
LAVLIKPDLVFLDLMLPDINGEDVITAVRERSQAPIIMLTARKHDDDVIMALNRGANDYVIKPFNPNVLLARMYAALRKFALDEAGVAEISNGPLRMDLVRHRVFLNDELLGLTPKEYDLLRYFIVHRGKMLTHRQILKDVWSPAHVEDTQYLRVYIRQVRAKIGKNPSVPIVIVTEPGIGYRMELTEAPVQAVA